MKPAYKIIGLLCVLGVAYSSAYFKAYSMSLDYFEHAEQQYSEGNYTLALKGANKQRLRRDEVYLGGYQQVIEAWESISFGPKPDFYHNSIETIPTIFDQLSIDELIEFVMIYLELDRRYVPEAATVLINKARDEGDELLVRDMEGLLKEAFPDYTI